MGAMKNLAIEGQHETEIFDDSVPDPEAADIQRLNQLLKDLEGYVRSTVQASVTYSGKENSPPRWLEMDSEMLARVRAEQVARGLRKPLPKRRPRAASNA